MAKKVVRRYYSKRLGRYVEKEYSYTKKYNKIKASPTLVYKSGKLNVKNIKTEYDRILNSEGSVQATLFDKTVKIQAERIKQGHRLRRLTIKSVEAMMAQDQIHTILINFNTDAQEVAELISTKYGATVDAEYILNIGNWVTKDNGKLTNKIKLPDGRVIELEFDYDNMVLV